MKLQEIENFEKTQAQVEGLHNELASLSKKAPNDGVNKFKLSMINQILVAADSILGEKYRPFDDFKIFDEVDVPTNSDVTLILSQFFNCLEKLRLDSVKEIYDYNAKRPEYFWIGDGENVKVRTSGPKKLR